jgi:phosphoribosylglycinamide formyltransferase 1
MKARLGILLSGGGSTYDNLETHIANGSLDAEVAVVVASKPGIGGIAHAQRHRRPLVIAGSTAEVSAALREHRVEWVIMCGWLKYWDPPAMYQGKTLNIHPSLLPAHGGKGKYGIHVHRSVIAAGDKETGCTVHHVHGAYDTGPILAQVKVPVLEKDTADSLQKRVMAAERELYPKVIGDLITAKISP